MKKILVTGADGFIGKALSRALTQKGFFVRGTVWRQEDLKKAEGCADLIVTGAVGPETVWAPALDGIDAVIHLAARVHVMRDKVQNPLAEYRRVNVEGTRRLAGVAVNVGVRRFIFLSSIKVNGEETPCDKPFTEQDSPDPRDDYALSKYEAEQVLRDIGSQGKMEIVILRAPLVYGPGVRANFKKLIEISAFPLPFKGIDNRRSLIFLGNLTDAIRTCVSHPMAGGETFLVCDGDDISTPDLIKEITAAMHKKPILFFAPIGMLRILAQITGKGNVLMRLAGSLVVDGGKIRDVLGWRPPYTLKEGIRATVDGAVI